MQKYSEKNVIGMQLRKALSDKKITAKRLAEEIGVSRTIVQMYLANTRCPSDETLKAISEFLGYPVEFFTGEPYDDEEVEAARVELIIDDMMTRTIEDYQLQEYYYGAIRSFEHTFEKVDLRKKMKMVLRMFELTREMNNVNNDIDITESEYCLEKIKEIYDRYYIDLSDEEIKSRLQRLSEDRVISKKGIVTTLRSIERGIVIGLSEKDYSRITKLDYIKELKLNKAFENYGRYTLYCLENIIDYILENNYVDGNFYFSEMILSLDPNASNNGRMSSKASTEAMDRLIKKVAKINDEMFPYITSIIINLGEGNIEGAKTGLNELLDCFNQH